MLSCLSPRSPCWGRKAALSLMSGRAARASSEWVRSAVTEAGGRAGAGRVGEQAVDAELDGLGHGGFRISMKPVAQMEIGLGGGVASAQ